MLGLETFRRSFLWLIYRKINKVDTASNRINEMISNNLVVAKERDNMADNVNITNQIPNMRNSIHPDTSKAEMEASSF